MQQKMEAVWGLRVSALALVAALAACGGGETPAVDPLDAQAQRLQARHEAGPTVRARAAVPGVDATEAANRLFALAESAYKQFFPSSQPTRKLNGWAYRHYPETGVYLAVIDWRVYVLGGPFGAEVQDLGELTRYVTVQPPSSGALTASRLALCPDSQATASDNFYTCMVGSLSGSQTFDSSKACTLTIASDGMVSLESAGARYAIARKDYGTSLYGKDARTGSFQVRLQVTPSVLPALALTLNGPNNSNAASFFVSGGEMTASAIQVVPSANLSCKFNLPA